MRLAFWLTAIAACTTDTADHRGTVVRDSAGVHIVESGAAAWQAGDEWRLGDAPIVDIGSGDTEEEQLFRVQGAIRLSDGTIIVANAGSAQLKFFSPSGGYLRAAGGDGSGPGEFSTGSGPWDVWRSHGDSIAAPDISNFRISFFDLQGAFGHSVTLQPEMGSFPMVIGLLTDNRLVTFDGLLGDESHPIGTRYRPLFRYQIYGRDGTRVSDIVDLPGFERLVYEWEGQNRSGTGPFGRLAWTAIRDSAFYYTSATTFEILRFQPGTDARSIFRAGIEPHPVTSQDIADYKAERSAAAPDDPAGRAAWLKWLDDVSYPDAFPTYRGLGVDAEGNLWAYLYNAPSDSIPKWMVFDADGQWLGTVTLPRNFSPHEIGSDYVIGVWRDPDDIEHVRVYELLKST